MHIDTTDCATCGKMWIRIFPNLHEILLLLNPYKSVRRIGNVGEISAVAERTTCMKGQLSLETDMGPTKNLEDALSRLRPLDKEIILLRHFDELSNAEAADVLHVPAATASKLYIRAMRRLKKQADATPKGSFQPFSALSSGEALIETWRANS